MTDGPPDETEPEPLNGLSFAVMGVIVQASLVLLAFPMGMLLDQPPLQSLRWEWSGLLWGVLATLPMVGLFFVLDHIPGDVFAPVRSFTFEVMVPLLRSCTLFQLFALSFLAGLGEEILFRGVVQTALTRDLSPVVGLVLASVLFGLMHTVNVPYTLLATGLGIYLGLVYIGTGNLLAPIVAHFLYDFFAMVYLTRETPEPEA